MSGRPTAARAHAGPGGLINPMEIDAMNLNTPRIDAGHLLGDEEFDELIRQKFPPVRHRADVSEFTNTIPMQHRCTGGSCRQGRQPCTTPEACRVQLDEDSDFGALEGLSRGMPYVILAWAAVAALLLAAWVMWRA